MSNEQDPLLPVPPDLQQERSSFRSEEVLTTNAYFEGQDESLSKNIYRILPAAFLANFGMTAAAASTVYAYAHILCVDPLSCEEGERDAYSGALVLATTISSACSILAVGPLRAMGRWNVKSVLLLWLICRGGSVGLLWIAAAMKNLPLAIGSKFIEGIAADNILQFGLGTIYAKLRDGRQFSTVMAESITLTLLGSSLGPLFAGLAKNFQARFLISICVFAVAATYLSLFVTLIPTEVSDPNENARDDCGSIPSKSWGRRHLERTLRQLFSHLYVFYTDPALVPPALALLLYATGQAYVFHALMVYASIRYGFSDRENGFLLSLGTGASALSLLTLKYTVLWLQETVGYPASAAGFNMTIAIITMVTFATTLPLLTASDKAWQVFPVTSLLSVGLGSGTFLKSYCTLLLGTPEDGPPVLVIIETLGGLLSPAVIGVAQLKLKDGMWCFVSSALITLAIMVLGLFALVRPFKAAESPE